jgi:hypothetical protein
MPRSYAILLASLVLCPPHASGQLPGHPSKRTAAVARGMTPAQVRQVLGEPLRVRREGARTYMEYANGCPGCTSDYVVVENCRVVAARFENPGRQMLATPAPDTSTPPAEECRVAATDTSAGAGESVVSTTSAGQSVAVSTPGGGMRATAAADTGKTGAAPSPGSTVTMVSDAADTTPRSPSRPSDMGPGGMAPAARTTAGVTGATVPEPARQEGNADEWRQRLSLRRPATHIIAVPAASLNTPTAFGVQMGEGYAGVAYQARTRYSSDDDAAAAIGLGFGNRRQVALEVTLSSFSTIRGGGPFETGGLSFKAHHAFGDSWGVAAGWENAVSWGRSDAGNSPFGVVTHVVRLNETGRPFSAVAASLGVGAGRFRTEQNIVDDKSTPNVFGSIGVQVAEPVSAIADWTGQDLYAGVSVAPIRRIPLLVNAGFADITGNAGNGARFVISAGVGFRWLRPFFW